ncbi:hypothetical protein [Roseovarius sp. Pro17]|uniref:hypothetical protein n=1 Tax=Roseovarius sp. Pro17 TaxID=3108175 RepID=UPI002D79BE90|nr:hypothetical protein [Roseovarius sp. Pro17]
MSTMTRINSPKGFEARITKVRRSHSRLAHGYEAKVGRDGLIVFRPKRRRRGVPLRSLIILIAAFVGFKVLVLMQIGDISYQERVNALASGTAPERIGAFAMQIDPVTRIIVQQVVPLFK